MKDKKILKGNKLIAIFMIDKDDKELKVPGMIYQQDAHDGIYIKDYLDKEDVESFKYHKSWDWLMPVVEKIGGTDWSSVDIHWGTGATDSFAWCDIEWSNGKEAFKTSEEINGDEQSLITAIWVAVVEFIKWYNKTK